MPTAILTTDCLAAKCIFSQSKSTGQSGRDTHVSLLPGCQCQTYVSASLTALKQPWMTATQAMLKRDGNTSMWPSTTLPWTFDKRKRQNHDWFEEGIAELEPVITAKRAVLVEYKRDPSEKSLAALRKARNDTEWIAWHCANDYWLNLCQSIQLSAVCGNIHAMYEGMKKAFGPSTTKIASLRSATGDIITDEANRWRG